MIQIDTAVLCQEITDIVIIQQCVDMWENSAYTFSRSKMSKELKIQDRPLASTVSRGFLKSVNSICHKQSELSLRKRNPTHTSNAELAESPCSTCYSNV